MLNRNNGNNVNIYTSGYTDIDTYTYMYMYRDTHTCTHIQTCACGRDLERNTKKNENMVVSYFKIFFRLKIRHLFPLRQILPTFVHWIPSSLPPLSMSAGFLPDARRNLESLRSCTRVRTTTCRFRAGPRLYRVNWALSHCTKS